MAIKYKRTKESLPLLPEPTVMYRLGALVTRSGVQADPYGYLLSEFGVAFLVYLLYLGDPSESINKVIGHFLVRYEGVFPSRKEAEKTAIAGLREEHRQMRHSGSDKPDLAPSEKTALR